MSAAANRTANIRRWVEEAGGPADFSRKVDGRWSPSLVSQWISFTNPKGIGHTVARAVEEALGKLPGSMDSQAVRLTGEKLRTAIQFGRDCLATLGVDSFNVEDPEDSEIVAAAFEYLEDHGIASPTDSDRLAFIRRLSEKRSEQRTIPGPSGQPGRAAGTAKAGKEIAVASRRRR